MGFGRGVGRNRLLIQANGPLILLLHLDGVRLLEELLRFDPALVGIEAAFTLRRRLIVVETIVIVPVFHTLAPYGLDGVRVGHLNCHTGPCGGSWDSLKSGKLNSGDTSRNVTSTRLPIATFSSFSAVKSLATKFEIRRKPSSAVGWPRCSSSSTSTTGYGAQSRNPA